MADVTPTPATGAGTPNGWGVITPAAAAPTPGANSWGVVLPSAAPKATTSAGPVGVNPVGTTGAFTKFLGLNDLTPTTPANTSVTTPAVAKGQVSSTDNSATGIIKNTIAGIPAAATKVSTAITDTVNAPLKAASDLLSNTDYIKQAASGMNADPKTGIAAQAVLKTLSDVSAEQALQGATGGIYKAQDTGPDNMLDTGLKSLAQVLGSLPTIGAIGEIAPTRVAPALGEYINKFPIAGKYLVPYTEQFVKLATGLAGYSQLNPDLGTDMAARFKAAATSIAQAPLYLALGAIGSPALRIPASGILGFGMAKLSGASNKDALQSGLLFSTMDALTTAGGTRGFTDAEAKEKISAEALDVLNKYAGDTKLTANSTPQEVDAVYNRAVHQASPKVGGDAQSLESVKSAYGILSGKENTAPEDSVDALHNETKRIVAKNGHGAAVETLKDSAGLDHNTATRIADAATVAHEPKDIKDVIAQDIKAKLGARSDEEVTAQSTDFVTKNIDSLTDAYIKKHGNVIGADEAKEFVPGYSDDRSTSDLVQRGAGKLADHVYNKLLDEKQGEGNNTVLITAGGTGAGKSTSIADTDTSQFPVVFDTNLSNAKGGIDRIQNALDKGYNVDLRFTYTRPDKAYDRVLDRAEQLAQKEGSGRPVSAQGHLDMHLGSHDALPEIIKHFDAEIKDGRIDLRLFDNSGMSPVEEKDPLDFITKIRDNRDNEKDYHTQLNDQRKLALSEGRISAKTNAGFDRAETLRPRKDSGGRVSGRVQESSKEPTPASDSVKDSESKIGKSIEAKAIEAGLTKGFPETAGYDATTFKEQAEKAAELFDSGIENARAVIRGDEPLPEGLKGEAVIAAAEEYLLHNPDADMAEELANSPLVTANSESAQGLSLSRMRTPDSATAKLQKLKQAKIDAAGGSKEIAKVRAKAKAAVNKILLPKEELSWDSFLDGITC